MTLPESPLSLDVLTHPESGQQHTWSRNVHRLAVVGGEATVGYCSRERCPSDQGFLYF